MGDAKSASDESHDPLPNGFYGYLVVAVCAIWISLIMVASLIAGYAPVNRQQIGRCLDLIGFGLSFVALLNKDRLTKIEKHIRTDYIPHMARQIWQGSLNPLRAPRIVFEKWLGLLIRASDAWDRALVRPTDDDSSMGRLLKAMYAGVLVVCLSPLALTIVWILRAALDASLSLQLLGYCLRMDLASLLLVAIMMSLWKMGILGLLLAVIACACYVVACLTVLVALLPVTVLVVVLIAPVVALILGVGFSAYCGTLLLIFPYAVLDWLYRLLRSHSKGWIQERITLFAVGLIIGLLGLILQVIR